MLTICLDNKYYLISFVLPNTRLIWNRFQTRHRWQELIRKKLCQSSWFIFRGTCTSNALPHSTANSTPPKYINYWLLEGQDYIYLATKRETTYYSRHYFLAHGSSDGVLFGFCERWEMDVLSNICISPFIRPRFEIQVLNVNLLLIDIDLKKGFLWLLWNRHPRVENRVSANRDNFYFTHFYI